MSDTKNEHTALKLGTGGDGLGDIASTQRLIAPEWPLINCVRRAWFGVNVSGIGVVMTISVPALMVLERAKPIPTARPFAKTVPITNFTRTGGDTPAKDS